MADAVHAIRIVDGEPRLELVTPRALGPSDALVHVKSASICGSDLHLIALGLAEGRVLGHEFAGLTSDGTAVAIEPIISCGSCAACEEGERTHCESGSQLIGLGVDGGMAEAVVVPSSTLVALPSGLDVRSASLVEPIAVALHGIKRAELRDHQRVLIVGAGAIGLATAAVLRSRGIGCDLIARHDHQREAGAQLGATVIEDHDESAGYDAVIDAVGTTETIRQAVQSLRPRGALVMLGVFWEPVAIDLDLLMKEVTLIPAMVYSGTGADRDFIEAARIVAEAPDIASSMITHRYPLEGAGEGFATANNRAAGAIKVVFEP